MAHKRPASELDSANTQHPRPRRESTKRAKLSPSAATAHARSNSSDSSACSVSEASALRSSPPASDDDREGHARRLSSFSSLEANDSVSEASSVSSSADEDDDSESSISNDDPSGNALEVGEEAVVTIGGPRKPQIRHVGSGPGAHGGELKARLAAFLPQMKQANAELEAGGKALSMEDVEEGEAHIEMNLGLGVLEQQNAEDGSSSSDQDSEVEEAAQEDPLDSSGATRKETEGGSRDVMRKLLGQDKMAAKEGLIEEMG